MALTKVTSGLISADASSVDLNIDAGTLYIDSTNNRVGIGTTSPSSYNSAGDNLVIAETSGGAGITLASSTTGSGHILFADSTTGTGAYDGFIRHDHTTSSMRFACGGGVERMRIDSSGNVGIGTTSPADTYSYGKALDIQSSTGGAVYMRDTADTTKFGFTSFDGTTDRLNVGTGGTGTYLRFITVGDERMRIDSSGFLQIATTSKTGRINLQPNPSNNHFVEFYTTADTKVGEINTTGGTTTNYVTSSDYRLKENVIYDWDATTRLKQLKPARFNFIADADKTVDGFLAHEVSSIVPEAIHGEKDEVDAEGNAVYQGIDQSKLVPLLVKTIQELEARITALEGE